MAAPCEYNGIAFLKCQLLVRLFGEFADFFYCTLIPHSDNLIVGKLSIAMAKADRQNLLKIG